MIKRTAYALLALLLAVPALADGLTTTRGFSTPRSIERDGRITPMTAIDVGGLSGESLI